MGLKSVDSFVKQLGKQHVVSVFRRRGKFYFDTQVPPVAKLKEWRLSGHVPPIKPYRNGYFVGRVVACRNAKTATVLYQSGKWRPYAYAKTTWGIKAHSKAHIHDEFEICNPGACWAPSP